MSSSVEEAIAQADATPYGLNAGVWSGGGARGRAVAARVHAGTVNVNEAFAAAWGSIDETWADLLTGALKVLKAVGVR